MAAAGEVDVQVRARLDVLERDLVRARARLDRFDKSARGGKGLQELEKGSSRAATAMRNLSNQVAILQGPLGPIAGRLSFLATGLGRVGGVALGAGLALTGLAVVVHKSLAAFQALEQEMATIQGVLQATGYASGKTADGSEEHTSELQSQR